MYLIFVVYYVMTLLWPVKQSNSDAPGLHSTSYSTDLYSPFPPNKIFDPAADNNPLANGSGASQSEHFEM